MSWPILLSLFLAFCTNLCSYILPKDCNYVAFEHNESNYTIFPIGSCLRSSGYKFICNNNKTLEIEDYKDSNCNGYPKQRSSYKLHKIYQNYSNKIHFQCNKQNCAFLEIKTNDNISFIEPKIEYHFLNICTRNPNIYPQKYSKFTCFDNGIIQHETYS